MCLCVCTCDGERIGMRENENKNENSRQHKYYRLLLLSKRLCALAESSLLSVSQLQMCFQITGSALVMPICYCQTDCDCCEVIIRDGHKMKYKMLFRCFIR